MLRSAICIVLLAYTLLAAPAVVAAGSCKLAKIIELPVTVTGMRPVTTVQIDGSSTSLLVDSGAEFSTMSAPSAASLHLSTYPVDRRFEMKGIVAGVTSVNLANVRSLTVAGLSLRDVEFLVGGSEVGGGVAGLLGQNVLHIADVEYDLAGGMIRLMQSSDCGNAVLAYWASGTSTPYSVMNIQAAEAWNEQTLGTRLGQAKQRYLHTVGTAYLNGALIRVLFDSGAPFSMLTLNAAARAGIRPEDSGVVRAGVIHGIGSGMVQTYLASVSSFKIGDEEIRNTRLRFGDIDLSWTHADMLLGADFFLSHRIYVANAERKLFFTYNGGPVFNLSVAAN
jgi:predicted aspartyl protease